jgi:23S rRNA pseudouridine2605 synthase
MAIIKKIQKMTQMDNKIRLNHYLARCGLGSRRKCDELISSGAVSVNGKIITQMGVRVEPNVDVITHDNKIMHLQDKLIYVLLNKPLRTITTAKDERHRKTVLDVVKIVDRIYPVGRLDYNTTGALLLTNDGDLAYFLAHPRFGISKVYRVLLDKRIRQIDLHNFRKGLNIGDFTTSPCRIEELRVLDNRSYLEVEIHEGKNRQLRRMFDSLNYNITELQRIEFAGLRIQNLKPGEWRFLTRQEIFRLKEIIKISRHKILGIEDGKK